MFTRGRRWAIPLTAIVAVTSCMPVAPAASPSAEPSAGGPVAGGRLVISISAEPASLNPLLHAAADIVEIGKAIYHPLIGVDPSGKPIAGLAQGWEHSADGTTLRFRLREGLRWSDGSDLTAEDFIFTVEAILRSKKSPRASAVQEIAGAVAFREGRTAAIEGLAVQGRDITIRLARPFCPALTSIGTLSVLPRAVFESYHRAGGNIDDAVENALPPVASGPYRLAQRVPKERLILQANRHFYGGRPLIDEIEVTITEGDAQTEGVLAGEIDVLSAAALDRPTRDRLRRSPELAYLSYFGARYTFVGWNLRSPSAPFLNRPAVRKALAYGLNVEAVINKYLDGDAVRVLAHVLPFSWAYDPSGLNEYRYDPAHARELLEGDGWTKDVHGIYQRDGQRLDFSITTFLDATDAVGLQRESVQQYGQIGIKVKSEMVEFNRMFERLRDPAHPDGAVDAMVGRWTGLLDPDSYEIWHTKGRNNLGGYSNPLVDRALEDGRTKCAPEDRKAAYRTVDRILNEEQPYLFALAPRSHLFYTKKLRGVEANPYTSWGWFWNVEKLWLEP